MVVVDGFTDSVEPKFFVMCAVMTMNSCHSIRRNDENIAFIFGKLKVIQAIAVSYVVNLSRCLWKRHVYVWLYVWWQVIV